MKIIRNNEKKTLGWFSKGFLSISLLGIVSTLFFVCWYNHINNNPKKDSFYVKKIEKYTDCSLGSCIVIHKLYYRKTENGAIYSLSDDDFQKVLQGVQKFKLNKYFKENQIINNNYHLLIIMDEAQSFKDNGFLNNKIGITARDFFRKEQIYTTQDFNYFFEINKYPQVVIGFKKPNLIYFYERFDNRLLM